MNCEMILGRVLITGGTGTFGNALCKHMLDDNLARTVTIFSRDENKQFHMKKMLGGKYGPRLKFYIGDVRDEYSLAKAFCDIDVVFHAAALKHVPVGEEFPEEVIETNVNGIKNVLDVADLNGVKKVVNLSSDKAVQPVNAYGMTKGLSEKLVAAHRGKVVGVSLRYGNVMGSRGSVIPLFLEQISEGRLMTVTNKDMTRFLLPIEEAIRLAVFCAKEDLTKGSLLVIKSPACTVESLVEAIGRSFNKGWESYDLLDVIEVGIRPGEKIHEVLLTKEEVARGYQVARSSLYVVPSSVDKKHNIDFSGSVEFTSENTERFSSKQVFDYLQKYKII